MGFPAVAVPDKPKVPDRIPIMRNWLRDRPGSVDFTRHARRMSSKVWVKPRTTSSHDAEQRNNLVIRIEQTLAEQQLDTATTRELRRCARSVCIVGASTRSGVQELQNNKKKRMNMNYGEIPGTG